jgi:hypothetical protein
MKIKLLALLLLCSFSSFAKGEGPAIDNGTYTLSAAWGFPETRKSYFPYGTSFGPISITADRQLTKRFSVDLQYAYTHSIADRMTLRIVQHGATSVSNIYYEQDSRYHSITAGGEYCYVNRNRLWMACGIALGLEVQKHNVLYLTDSTNVDRSNEIYAAKKPFLNYRLRFVDAKYTIGKNLGLCASFGFGMDGILTFGVLYRFTGKD